MGPPLGAQGARIKITTLHKANTGIIEISLDDLTPVGRVTRYNTGNFQIPQSSVDSHLYSFFPNANTIRVWNNLLQHIKACETLASLNMKTLNCRHLGLGLWDAY